jgi:hypothetical protein
MVPVLRLTLQHPQPLICCLGRAPLMADEESKQSAHHSFILYFHLALPWWLINS